MEMDRTRKNQSSSYALVCEHSHEISFRTYDDVNDELKLQHKTAALKVSPCVVGVQVYSGEQLIHFGSGFIFESNIVNGCYHGNIITSATLISKGRIIASDLKVNVFLRGGKTHVADILCWNLSYNLLLLQIKSEVPLTTAQFKEIDDSLIVGPDNKSFQLRPHRKEKKLIPGETMIALGRSYQGEHSLMASAGSFSIEFCKLDCKELLRVNCRISKAGIGGPMLSTDGEILGINFYATYYTPFLPSNVILLWLDHNNKNLAFPRPQLEIQLASLYSANEEILRRFMQLCLDISGGVIVEKVANGSSMAGLKVEDIIIQCSGRKIESLLQLLDIARENIGENVELVVLRPGEGLLNISVVLAVKSTSELASWPLPRESERMTRCLR